MLSVRYGYHCTCRPIHCSEQLDHSVCLIDTGETPEGERHVKVKERCPRHELSRKVRVEPLF